MSQFFCFPIQRYLAMAVEIYSPRSGLADGLVYIEVGSLCMHLFFFSYGRGIIVSVIVPYNVGGSLYRLARRLTAPIIRCCNLFY